jgi:hypothetical protein
VNEFRTWESGITPVLHSAMAVLNACDRACECQWAPALVAHADQIGAAARTVEEWVEDHHCPYPDLDFLLVGPFLRVPRRQPDGVGRGRLDRRLG